MSMVPGMVNWRMNNISVPCGCCPAEQESNGTTGRISPHMNYTSSVSQSEKDGRPPKWAASLCAGRNHLGDFPAARRRLRGRLGGIRPVYWFIGTVPCLKAWTLWRGLRYFYPSYVGPRQAIPLPPLLLFLPNQLPPPYCGRFPSVVQWNIASLYRYIHIRPQRTVEIGVGA